MKHGCGLVAATNWTRTGQGLGLCVVVDWTPTCMRTGCERGLCADTDKLRSWSRTCCGHGPDMVMDTANLWSLSVHGLATAKMGARTDCGRGCGLDKATASRPDNWPDISRINRDFFADIRTLKMQGVRRPLLNPHKIVWAFLQNLMRQSCNVAAEFSSTMACHLMKITTH